MRFAITGGDGCVGIFRALVEAGWQPLKLFTLPVDKRNDFNSTVVGYIRDSGIEIQMSRLSEDDLAGLQRKRCDILVVAGYDWRVPPWRPYLRYAVNFHPSPLPLGRGPAPLARAIIEQHSIWGVSCHRLEQEFDTGDILAQEYFPLAPGDCLESLELQTQMAAARLAQRVAIDFKALWDAARPQTIEDYWPKPGVAERTLDFNLPVADILRHVRAFGALECLARVKDSWVRVRRAIGWRQPHGNRPGAVVHSSGRSMVVAAGNGYVGLLEWYPVEMQAGTGKDTGIDPPIQGTPILTRAESSRDGIHA